MTKTATVIAAIEALERCLVGMTNAKIDLQVQAILRELVILKIQLENLK